MRGVEHASKPSSRKQESQESPLNSPSFFYMKLVAGEHFLKPLGGGLGGALERIVVHVHETETFGVAASPLCEIGATQTTQGG